MSPFRRLTFWLCGKLAVCWTVLAQAPLAAPPPCVNGIRVSDAEFAWAVESVTSVAPNETRPSPPTAGAPAETELPTKIYALACEELRHFHAETSVAREVGLVAESFDELRQAFQGSTGPAKPYGPASLSWAEYVRQTRSRLAVATRRALMPSLRLQSDYRSEYEAHPELWREPDVRRVRLRAIAPTTLPPGVPAEVTVGGPFGQDEELPNDLRAAALTLEPGTVSAPLRWGAARLTLQCVGYRRGERIPFVEARSLMIARRAAAEYRRRVQDAMARTVISP